MNTSTATKQFEDNIGMLKDITRKVWSETFDFHNRCFSKYPPEQAKRVLNRLANMRQITRNREFEQYWAGRGGAAGQGRG